MRKEAYWEYERLTKRRFLTEIEFFGSPSKYGYPYNLGFILREVLGFCLLNKKFLESIRLIADTPDFLPKSREQENSMI